MKTLLAKVLVRDTATNTYLILRSSLWRENPRRSLKPDLPGGVVEPGETAIEGAVRELMEETGITVESDKMQLVMKVEETRKAKEYLRYMYFCETTSPSITLSWEHDTYWWMTAEEVLELDIRAPYPEFFQTLQQEKLLR